VEHDRNLDFPTVRSSIRRRVSDATSPPRSPKSLREGPLDQADGQLLASDRPLERGAAIEIVMRESPEALDTIRHDTAHIMAEAVQELFPGAQVTIGPNIEDGFFYDFARDEGRSVWTTCRRSRRG